MAKASYLNVPTETPSALLSRPSSPRPDLEISCPPTGNSVVRRSGELLSAYREILLTVDKRSVLCERYVSTDPQTLCAMGIRRRLAPLIDNDRTLSKLLHTLLVSVPGIPCLYYGDEIGMGDNTYLNDRDGVRTPMQWTSDRNGGFSRADPARVYPPPLMDPVFGYQAVNVEAQRLDPNSSLHWVRRTLAVRMTRGELFETGDFEDVSPRNPAILAFVRRLGDQAVLCVYNLSPFVQQFELPLAAFEGRAPVPLFGGDPLSIVGRSTYQWMSGGHAFDWLDLREPGVIEGTAA